MSPGFNLDDYVTVGERLADFRERYPQGRILTEVIELPGPFSNKFIAVKASVWRDEGSVGGPPDGTGLAWEPVPGPTQFVRDSELMNAETAAVGRGLINALVADSKKGIASRDEIRSAAGKRDAESKGGRPSGGGNPVAPSRSGGKSSIPPSKDETVGATSQPSTTPKSDTGVEESDVLGKDGASTPPVSEHVHDWEPAPNKDAADRGYMVCKTCRVSKKDPV